MTNKKTTLAIMLAVSFTSSLAVAQQSGRRGPPPEAIEACANLAVQDACSFTGHRGDATGQCVAAPDDQSMLACLPEGGQQRQRNSN